MQTTITENGFSVCFDKLLNGEFVPFAEIDRNGTIIKYSLSKAKSKSISSPRSASTWYGPGISRTIAANFKDISIYIRIIELSPAASADGFIIDIDLLNNSNDNLHIMKLGFESEKIEVGEGKFYTSSLYGDFWTASLDEKLPANKSRNCKEYLTLYRKNKSNEDGVIFAPCGNPEAYLNYTPVSLGSNSLALRIFSEMDGVKVIPGASRSSQSIICARGGFDPLIKRILGELSVTHGSRTRFKPQTGWCSWYDKANEITAQTISQTLSIFEKNKNELKLDFIQIDDGYQISLGQWGTNEKFPDGLHPFTRRISALGARPGIWMAPILVSENSPMFRDHPEAFSRHPDGSFARSMEMRGDIARALDATHPETRAYLKNILQDKLDDGFTYFKIDFNHIKVDGRCAYDPTKTSLQAYRDIYRFYRDVLGEDTYILSCSGFERATFGAADGSRVGTDSSAYWSDDLCSIPSSIYEICNKSAANRLIYTCDPDVTYLAPRKEIDENKRRIWHSLVGLYGGMIQISDPMEHRLDKFDMFRIIQPSEIPQAKSVFPCTDRENRRFGFVTSKISENCGVFLIYNRTNNSETLNTELYPLYEIGDKFHIWSFWDQQYLGEGSPCSNITLEPASCKLLRFTPIRTDGSPVLIGSSLHISCGAGETEIASRQKNSLTIRLYPIGAASGNVYLQSQKKIVSISSQGCEAKLTNLNENIYKILISERNNKEQILTILTE